MHVAAELHDGPIQRLAVLSYDLERARQRVLGNPAAVARTDHAQAAAPGWRARCGSTWTAASTASASSPRPPRTWSATATSALPPCRSGSRWPAAGSRSTLTPAPGCGSGPCSGCPGGIAAVDPLLEADGHGVARLLADRPADVGLDGEHVGAVAQGHEGALEGVAVDRPPDLDQPPGAEELDLLGPDEIGPAALVGTLPQLGGELLVHDRPPGVVALTPPRRG